MTSESQSRPARGRRSHSERREESAHRHLDAASSLIADRGCAKMVLAEVGVRAGYSPTLPVHYFKTKEALIAAVTERISAHYSAYLQAELHGVQGLSAVRTFIRTFIQHVIEYPLMRRAWFMILTEAASDPQLRSAVSGPRTSAVNDISAFLRQAERTGDICEGTDLELQASLIHGSLRGLIELWVIDPQSIDLAALAAGFADLALRGLQR